MRTLRAPGALSATLSSTWPSVSYLHAYTSFRLAPSSPSPPVLMQLLHTDAQPPLLQSLTFPPCRIQVLRIDAIPAKALDTIKDWLNSVGIKYYESKLNLAWKPILKCAGCVGCRWASRCHTAMSDDAQKLGSLREREIRERAADASGAGEVRACGLAIADCIVSLPITSLAQLLCFMPVNCSTGKDYNFACMPHAGPSLRTPRPSLRMGGGSS